ncbi:hypothetical protein Q3G72_006822 [Acer saccharum]|nr:hypothetical protein Q3G72_006822 [Acer saccharum]
MQPPPTSSRAVTVRYHCKMGGYDSDRDSKDGRDEDDEEEYEEVDNQLLGFMFGNVDNAGDLDVDYLDEDAKEHLAALAEELGSSLTDIDLSVKSPQTPAGAVEQDYGEKAEDAVDYEDIDEQYEGPEIQAANYDEHEEFEKEHEVVDKEIEVSTVPLSGEKGECGLAVLQGEKSIEDEQQVGSLGNEEVMAVEGEVIC